MRELLRSAPDMRYRLLWALALLGCLMLVHFNVRGLSGAPEGGLPTQFIFPGNDLVVYLRAGQAIADGESPYPQGAWGDTAVFHYSPTFALAIGQLVKGMPANLPFRQLAYLHLALILAAFPVAWVAWRGVFHQLELEAAEAAMMAWLPLWLVYSQWFADQNYLNIYTFLLLLTGLLALALLQERLLLSVVLALIIAQTKPHYLFPLFLPLMSGRWRFFAKVAIGSIAGYTLVVGATIVALGPHFGRALYADYIVFLTTIAERYPWSGYYLGYNHSWQSILNWIFGLRSWIPAAVTGLRFALFVPLGWLGLRWWRDRDSGIDRTTAALGVAFAGHLWLITSLDQLWEITAVIVIFPYLLAVGSGWVRWLATAICVPFALLGVAQLAGWELGSVLGLSFGQLDVTERLPVIMATGLGLYGLTLWTVINDF
jgi:hypothetical protein